MCGSLSHTPRPTCPSPAKHSKPCTDRPRISLVNNERPLSRFSPPVCVCVCVRFRDLPIAVVVFFFVVEDLVAQRSHCRGPNIMTKMADGVDIDLYADDLEQDFAQVIRLVRRIDRVRLSSCRGRGVVTDAMFGDDAAARFSCRYTS